MKLQYFGHSCFRIISDMGTTIVTDPFCGTMVGFDMPHIRCDAVTVSHHHDDHDCMEAIVNNPAVLDVAGNCLADDIAINSYETFHDDQKGKLRGKNLVFVFELEGIRLAHMGDIGCLDEHLVEQVGKVDVLLVPVGSVYTVDAVGAKWYADKLGAKIIVPMHYHTEEHAFSIDNVDKFLDLYSKDAIKIQLSPTLEVDWIDEEAPTTVVVLPRMAD
ncbi:MAG: MBL fold metallo-hydrolase [Clostridia bacterium]|nr:MBL fold metallo-hydrolase [Clostridia bacterium]